MSATLNVADQKGLLRALCDAAHTLDSAHYTIAWSEFPAAASLLEARNAGAVDVGVAGDSPVMFGYAARAPVHALLALWAQAPDAVGLLVPLHSSTRGVTDLRGRLIAVTKGSIGQALVLGSLRQARLSAHDVRFAYLSQMDASTALRAGSIDAWGTWQPYIALQIAQGEARVLADGSSVPRGASYLVSSTYALAGKSAVIGDFVRRLRQARHWGDAHAGNYATLYAQNTGVPLGIARRVSMALVGVPVPMDANLLATERTVLSLFVQAGIVPAAPDIAGLFDRRLEPPATE